MKRCYGRFELSQELIRDNTDVAMSVFKNVIVLKADAIYVRDTIEYMAYCKDFKEVELGGTVPFYNALFGNDGKFSHWIERTT